MKMEFLALCAVLTLSLPATAQNAAPTAPVTATVPQEGCAGTSTEACQAAQA